MFNRVKNKYIAVIQNGQSGETAEVAFNCHWSPEWDGVFDAVAQAAASMAWWASSKDNAQRVPFVGLTARVAEESA